MEPWMQPDDEPNPERETCPECHAKPGLPCTAKFAGTVKQVVWFHRDRVDLAHEEFNRLIQIGERADDAVRIAKRLKEIEVAREALQRVFEEAYGEEFSERLMESDLLHELDERHQALTIELGEMA